MIDRPMIDKLRSMLVVGAGELGMAVLRQLAQRAALENTLNQRKATPVVGVERWAREHLEPKGVSAAT